MGVMEMIVAVVLIATLGEVAKALLGRAPRALDAKVEERIRALEAELRASEGRLAQTEEQVAELTEKLDFVESLLVEPERPTELPPPPGEGASPR